MLIWFHCIVGVCSNIATEVRAAARRAPNLTEAALRQRAELDPRLIACCCGRKPRPSWVSGKAASMLRYVVSRRNSRRRCNERDSDLCTVTHSACKPRDAAGG